MKNKIYQFLFTLICLFPVKVLAVNELPLGRPITFNYLSTVVLTISIFVIRMSAVLAVIFIVWSGITYMYAGDDTKKVEAARVRLMSGIIGAAIVFGVGVILQTIVGIITGDFFCDVVCV